MGLVDALIEWTRETFMQIGDIGLFILAFIESSIFPIPPDIMLIALALINANLAFYYATLATIGSVLGGIAGYYIGLKGGRRLALRIFPSSMIDRADDYFKEYGVWTVLIAAFSPIPYKVFTISAGIFKVDIRKFTLASIVGRGARFYAEGMLIMLYGEQMIEFIDGNLQIITILVALLIIALVVVRKRLTIVRRNYDREDKNGL